MTEDADPRQAPLRRVSSRRRIPLANGGASSRITLVCGHALTCKACYNRTRMRCVECAEEAKR